MKTHGRRGAVRYKTLLDTKYTPTSLAEKTGLSKSHLSRVFRRKHAISHDSLALIARALGMTQASLRDVLVVTSRAR